MSTWWQSLGWRPALILALLALLAFLAPFIARDAAKRRRCRLLDRLNSPFFRNVYSSYYEARK